MILVRLRIAAWLLLFCSGLAAADEMVVAPRIASAIARVYPALVQVHAVSVGYADGREVKGESVGSGTIIDRQGHVITNHHVAGKATRIGVRLSNKEELPARLVGSDPLSDIAILQIDLSGYHGTLAVAEFGDSDALRVGQQVLAMGCPQAISQSVTLGIVSNRDFVMPQFFWPANTFSIEDEDVGSLVKWIAHDAAIYPGNSGGPLVDLDGRIVGINEIKVGLAGAIPGSLAHEVADQIIGHGAVERGWIGLVCQPLLRGSAVAHGALVADVTHGSPADTAGFRAGDILQSLNGRAVDVHFAEDLQQFNRQVFALPIGRPVAAVVSRDGKAVPLQVQVRRREAARGDEVVLSTWGITARQITAPMALEMSRRPDGVLVSTVRPGGAADDARPSLQPGDVIVRVGAQEVHGLPDLQRLTAAAPLLVSFERNQQRMLTVVKLGTPPPQDKPSQVQKAWLPIAHQVLTPDLAAALQISGKTGIVVTRVYGDVAGLKVGDVVVAVDGNAVESSQVEEVEVFPHMIRQYRPAATVDLTVLRPPQRAPIKLTVRLSERPTEESATRHFQDARFEFEVRDLAYADSIAPPPVPTRGAVVTEVQSGGWAALAHLAVGDVILSVDGAAVGGVADLQQRMRQVAERRPAHVSFFVRRGIHTLFLEMEPAWRTSR